MKINLIIMLPRHLIEAVKAASLWLLMLSLLVGCDRRTHETPLGPDCLDLSGNAVNPLQPGSIAVLIFISNECPISNRYSPEIRRLAETYPPRGVRFWLVHASPDESIESIQRHTTEYRLPGPIIRDLQQKLVKRCQVKVTPEAAVFSAAGELIYHGRIDDRALALGQEQVAVQQHDLEAVISSLLNGNRVAVHSTKAVGCSIPPLP